MTLRQKYAGGVVVERTDYYWDDRGLLQRVKLPAADSANPSSRESVWYTYDGAGRLIGRKDADGAKSFVQTGWDIVEEVDEITKERTYYTGASMIRDNADLRMFPSASADNSGSSSGSGSPEAGSSATGYNSSALYFHFDHLGNTRLVTDEQGAVVQRFNYEGYGRAVDATGQGVSDLTLSGYPYLFVGAYGVRYDGKTEMHYMRMRWYNPNRCRFINSDVLYGINRYSYAVCNPMVFIDLTGAQPELVLPENPPAPSPLDYYDSKNRIPGSGFDYELYKSNYRWRQVMKIAKQYKIPGKLAYYWVNENDDSEIPKNLRGDQEFREIVLAYRAIYKYKMKVAKKGVCSTYSRYTYKYLQRMVKTNKYSIHVIALAIKMYDNGKGFDDYTYFHRAVLIKNKKTGKWVTILDPFQANWLYSDRPKVWDLPDWFLHEKEELEGSTEIKIDPKSIIDEYMR